MAGTYAKQGLLRRLPVPALRETIPRYIDTIAPFASLGDMSRLRQLGGELTVKGGVGDVLQQRLESYREGKANWLEQWWDGSYLAHRGPLPVDMNYFLEVKPADGASNAVGTSSVPSDLAIGDSASQARIASSAIRSSLRFREQLRQQTFPAAETRAGPLCMSQYARLFSHARKAKPEVDEMVCYEAVTEELTHQHFATTFARPTSLEQAEAASGNDPKADLGAPSLEEAGRNRCVTLLCNGHAALVPVTNAQGLPRSDIEASVAAAIASARSQPRGLAPAAAHTALPRDAAAEARAAMEGHSAAARSQLAAVDSSLFVVCVDDDVPTREISRHARSHAIMVGQRGGDRWFDKHCLVVQPNGATSLLMEHAPGDGTMTLDWVGAIRSGFADDFGAGAQPVAPGSGTFLLLSALDGAAAAACPEQTQQGCHAVSQWWDTTSTTVATGSFWEAGSGVGRAGGWSADALAQAAFQVAQARLGGAPVPTYESCATRLCLHGRTEVGRTASVPAVRLAQALAGDRSLGGAPQLVSEQREWLLQLLRDQQQAQGAYMRLAREGLAVDRHVFGLRQMLGELQASEGVGDLSTAEGQAAARARGAGLLIDPLALYSGHWRLSTSNCGSPDTQLFGFGPVVGDGYGLGYVIHDGTLTVNVTTYEDGRQSSAAMAEAIEGAVADLGALVSQADADQGRWGPNGHGVWCPPPSVEQDK